MLKKIEENDINRLKQLQEEFNKKTFEFGRLYQAKLEIDNQLKDWSEADEKLKVEYLKIQDQETKLATELESKYGRGIVNLETGEIKVE